MIRIVCFRNQRKQNGSHFIQNIKNCTSKFTKKKGTFQVEQKTKKKEKKLKLSTLKTEKKLFIYKVILFSFFTQSFIR